MSSEKIFREALEYEEQIRDLYREAAKNIDDDRGKSIFNSLADDEQTHIDFLMYSLEQLKNNAAIDLEKLSTPLPTNQQISSSIEKIKADIPTQMLGAIKIVLNSALQTEKATSEFYEKAAAKTEGEIRLIFEKFLEIEHRHVDIVQTELDHASNYGVWFDFMEINLELE